MKYLIHYWYLDIHGERVFNWAWTDDDATIENLQSLIESIKNRDLNVEFCNIYPLPNFPEDILYSKDGSIKL